ncbi:MAG: RNA 2',3'-cyclic phosphodiesterase [Patescibacteria group bacterium]
MGKFKKSPERIFLSIRIPDQLKRELAKVQRFFADNSENLNFVNPDQLHITLAFLGWISEETKKRAERAATVVAESMTEFSVYPTTLSAFPRINRPSVIWIGLGGESEKLNLLTKKLIDTLMRYGVKIITSGDIYSPHITLARIKTQSKHRQFSQLRDLIENTKVDLKSFQIPIKQIMAYKSDLRHLGPKHIPLFFAPLKSKITKSTSLTAVQP